MLVCLSLPLRGQIACQSVCRKCLGKACGTAAVLSLLGSNGPRSGRASLVQYSMCVCGGGGACSFGRPAAAGIVQTAWVETLLEEACPEVVQPLPAPGLWLHSSVPDDLTLSSLPQSVGSQSAGSAGSECRVRSFVLACGGFWGRRGALQHDGGLLAVMQCRLQQPADVGVGQAACSLQLLHSHLQALRRRTVDCIV